MAHKISARLRGKTILITGASSGIGRSTAFEFARSSPEDLRLILTARRFAKLQDVQREIQDEIGSGVKILVCQLDSSNPDEIRQFVASLPLEWKNIDILVNNA
jgi:3-hydroxy acid dehydrogenase / malonic semialdehyde reductase